MSLVPASALAAVDPVQREQAESATDDRLHFSSLEPVVIGMPQLCRVGLSETWLLKACGHRHWLALAHAFGLREPRFSNEAGERLYPAFTTVAVSAARFQAVRENDRLDFALELQRIGRTRFASAISISIRGVPIADIRMETAFVRRAIAGRNRSAARALVARPCRLLAPSTRAAPPFRADAWEECGGFRHGEREILARYRIDPSPHEDFNGADFLYFSAFQAMIDRAEWHWFRRVSPALVTADRTIHYMGNIELGERVLALLCGERQGPSTLAHWTELRRESDESLIGIAFTHRQDASAS